MSDKRVYNLHGYDFEMYPDAIDDIELIPKIEEIMQKGDAYPSLVIDFVKSVLGEDEYAKMVAHFKKTEGRFKISYLKDLFVIMMQAPSLKDEASSGQK